MPGSFWHVRYPIKGEDGYVEVATTRPETMFGDTAVAVNPEDENMKHLIGKTLILPVVGREIPVIADDYVEIGFGTGCVKITPAHDPNDFEVGRRCRLPMEVVLTEDAKITENYPKYAGMDRYEARKAILADLEAAGLLKEVDASIKDYQKISEALDQHYLYLEQYESKLGAGLYGDVIQEVQNAYDDCSIDGTEAVDSILLMLNEALQECIQSDNIEEGDILTEYIKNPSFEDLTAQGGNNSDGSAAPPTGWEIYMEGAQVTTAAEVSAATGGTWCAINSGDNLSDVYDADGNPVTNQYTDGEHLWGLWSNKVPVVELSQTIKGLPAGQYTLTADIVVQNDWAGANLGMQRLFANDYVVMFGAETDYIQNADELLYTTFPEDVLMAAEIDGLAGEATVKHLNYAGNYKNENYGASSIPYTTTLVFGLAEDGDVTLGFRSSRISAVDGQLSGQASLGWFKLDNFTLTYDSATVPAGAEINAGATGIDATENASEATAVEFYSINGVRLAAPQKGINIVKMSDGTVSKVLVK